MYTIEILKGATAERAQRALTDALASSRFRAEVKVASVGTLHVKPVRLKSPKEYCGQHPGECVVVLGGERPKCRSSCLEWEDWVEFHALVNRVLDRLQVTADAYTNPAEPLDRGRRMYVRRGGLGARRKWDWETDHSKDSHGRFRVWNHGTPDQFAA